MIESKTHQAIRQHTREARNASTQERRANGWGYRKVPVRVSAFETTDAEGALLLLATSDTPAESGRYFAVTERAGKWQCSCGAFRSLGGCHHIGHLASMGSDAKIAKEAPGGRR